MEKCVVFYDDSTFEKGFAEDLCAGVENRSAQPATVCGDSMIYRENASVVGFVIHSRQGNLSKEMKNLLNRIVMPKNNYIFIVISSGVKERHSLRTAFSFLQSRGYVVSKVFTEGVLHSVSGKRKEQIQAIIRAIDERHDDCLVCEQLSSKKLRKDIRHYINEIRNNNSK